MSLRLGLGCGTALWVILVRRKVMSIRFYNLKPIAALQNKIYFIEVGCSVNGKFKTFDRNYELLSKPKQTTILVLFVN